MIGLAGGVRAPVLILQTTNSIPILHLRKTYLPEGKQFSSLNCLLRKLMEHFTDEKRVQQAPLNKDGLSSRREISENIQ